MARKRSIKRRAGLFIGECDSQLATIAADWANLSQGEQSATSEYFLTTLYREFEHLMLDVIVAAINNDSSTISTATGVAFPKHMTDEVCEYLVIGNGYFDFKGRDGLIKKLKQFLPFDNASTANTHYLITIITDNAYRQTLEQFIALRNHAVHFSTVSKKSAKQACAFQKLGSSGSWLRVGNRLTTLINSLKAAATAIQAAAPY